MADNGGRRFAVHYSRWLRPLFVLLGMGPKRSWVEVDDLEVRVRMGVWFRATIPRSSIVRARRSQDIWWAIGVHTDFRGHWLVNGSWRGIVSLDLDPPAQGRSIVRIHPKGVGLSLEDPDGFLTAIGFADTTTT